MFSYLCIKINPEVTRLSRCPVMVLWEMFNCSCCFVVVKSCDSDFILCLHFSCHRKWKMKPLVLLVLVICTVVSMNLKLVSKRNSGKSQKNIFTFESGPSGYAIKHFICFLFCIYTSCSLLKKKSVLTNVVCLPDVTGCIFWLCSVDVTLSYLKVSLCFLLLFKKTKKVWKPTKEIMTLALF